MHACRDVRHAVGRPTPPMQLHSIYSYIHRALLRVACLLTIVLWPQNGTSVKLMPASYIWVQWICPASYLSSRICSFGAYTHDGEALLHMVRTVILIRCVHWCTWPICFPYIYAPSHAYNYFQAKWSICVIEDGDMACMTTDEHVDEISSDMNHYLIDVSAQCLFGSGMSFIPHVIFFHPLFKHI